MTSAKNTFHLSKHRIIWYYFSRVDFWSADTIRKNCLQCLFCIHELLVFHCVLFPVFFLHISYFNLNSYCSAFLGSPAITDLLPDNLEAVLIPDQGFHQVGPADLCTDMFVLSVTVAFATKLEQVRTALSLTSIQ